MKALELAKKLAELIREHGNMEVAIVDGLNMMFKKTDDLRIEPADPGIYKVPTLEIIIAHCSDITEADTGGNDGCEDEEET